MKKQSNTGSPFKKTASSKAPKDKSPVGRTQAKPGFGLDTINKKLGASGSRRTRKERAQDKTGIHTVDPSDQVSKSPVKPTLSKSISSKSKTSKTGASKLANPGKSKPKMQNKDSLEAP
jgi:hypothetical protein